MLVYNGVETAYSRTKVNTEPFGRNFFNNTAVIHSLMRRRHSILRISVKLSRLAFFHIKRRVKIFNLAGQSSFKIGYVKFCHGVNAVSARHKTVPKIVCIVSDRRNNAHTRYNHSLVHIKILS